MNVASWLWIPITVWAAFAQTLRNTAQRQLTRTLGTWGATLVRFLYGLPFALLWLGAVSTWSGERWSPMCGTFFTWVTLGAVGQILATACLLRAMQERSFALAVAYSKTDILQVALFGLLFLGDPLSLFGALAVLAGTLGVLLLSPVPADGADPDRPWRALACGWTNRAAAFGLGSGAGFALASVGFRAATLQLADSFVIAAARTLVVALCMQTLLLGGYLAWRHAGVLRGVLREWRASWFAGFMGAAASVGWFTAFALTTAAQVRTLGLVELLFSYTISRQWFREPLSGQEMLGMALLGVGLVLIVMPR
jgi:uncharacterized membrane protein